MAWSLGLRLKLYGECRLDGAAVQPAEIELDLQRAGPRRFVAQGVLTCPALGQRSVAGVWFLPATLELELGDGWAFDGHPDPAAPRSLLGKSLWVGPLLQARKPRGSLRLRLDLRHDWLPLLRSVHVHYP